MLALVAAVTWLPDLLQPKPPQAQVLQSDISCSIKQSSCTASLGERQIKLSVTPNEIRSTIPLQFEAVLSGIDADAVQLTLEGRDMYMGINQTPLSPVAEGNHTWQGISELAVCTTGEMIWRARITAREGQNIIEANFDFSAR